MLGRFDEAWSEAVDASERLRGLGGMGDEQVLAAIASFAGDHRVAADYLRHFCNYLEGRGLDGLLSTYAPLLAHELCRLGQYEEAAKLAKLGRELGAADDVPTQIAAREAVALAEATDHLNDQGEALCDLAEVLSAAGRTGEAVAAFEQALDRYERKKNLAMVAQVRARLETLRAGSRA